MLKRFIIMGLLLSIFIFTAAAQEEKPKFELTGELITIYSFGNMTYDQRIDTDPNTAGAFFYNPLTGTRKNGFYTTATTFARFNPTSWLSGEFRFLADHRPGSFYMPLSMENLSRKDFTVTLDQAWGRASVFGALGLEEMPLGMDLFLKAGKYKAEANQSQNGIGVVSKYRIERVLYMMNTKTDFTYELGFAINDPLKLSLSASTNYLLNQSVQVLYDEDGAFKHGNFYLNQYDPQFLIALRLLDFYNTSAELLYGMNVSNIYSGNSFGAQVKHIIKISDDPNNGVSIPIGLSFGFHEKNIDMLGMAAIAEDLKWPNATTTISTVDFRDSMGFALGAGLRYASPLIDVEFNLAAAFYMIEHFYRDNLNILKASADTMITIDDKYFVGGGVILGNLLDSRWQTREGVTDDNYDMTFGIEENMGFEVYGGLNLGTSGKFVIGFNQNKGLSLNSMLETRHDAQLKFTQEDSSWGVDQLAEASSLYFKFLLKF